MTLVVVPAAHARSGRQPLDYRIGLASVTQLASDTDEGVELRPLGDLNGDRQPDFEMTLVRFDDKTDEFRSRRRVILGPLPRGRLPASRVRGFVLVRTGRPLQAAGDVNGDGLDDVAVQEGARTYVVFSSRSRDVVKLSRLGRRGFSISGVKPRKPTNIHRSELSAAGDVNGDGLADLVVGSPAASPRARPNAGSVYVVFGRRSSRPVRLDHIGAGGFRIDGASPRDFLGTGAIGAGDVNGDRLADILIGDRLYQPSSGERPVTVVFGRRGNTPVDLAALDGDGFNVINAHSDVGEETAPVGDLNGDGMADIAIAVYDDRAVYVVYGRPTPETVDIRTLGDRGIVISSTHPKPSFLGSEPGREIVFGPGDVTGDGIADLVVGPSKTFVLHGGRALPQRIDADRLGPGMARDLPDSQLSAAGDVNHDGRGDLLIEIDGGYECPYDEPGYRSSVFLVLSPLRSVRAPAFTRYTRHADLLAGTSDTDAIFGSRGNDRLVGRAGNDCLVGGRDDIPGEAAEPTQRAPRPDNDLLRGGPGNDRLTGGAGRDLLLGGSGDDVLEGGSGFDVLKGGRGNDVLTGYDQDVFGDAADRYLAGPGNDELHSADLQPQTLDCGPGRDRATVDRLDRTVACEWIHVRRRFSYY